MVWHMAAASADPLAGEDDLSTAWAELVGEDGVFDSSDEEDMMEMLHAAVAEGSADAAALAPTPYGKAVPRTPPPCDGKLPEGV